MAVYCNKCGAANADGSEFCTRCGAQIVQAQKDELVLPDWLKQAASESHVAAPANARTIRSSGESNSAPPARPSIPTGDLAASMPSWLKAVPIDEAPAHEQESLLTDPSDTRGFITEDDLPAWIRQIAIEEDAKQAEREKAAQAAAEAAAASAESSADAGSPTRRRLLPGEIDAARPNASAWLARGDRPAAGAPPPAARPVSALTPEPVTRGVEPAPTSSTATAKSGRKFTMPSRDDVTMRQVLIAAVVVALIVAILIAALL